MLRTAAAGGHDEGAGSSNSTRWSPLGGQYQREVNGKLCRFDGIHFSLFCSKLLQPDVLSATRKLIDGS